MSLNYVSDRTGTVALRVDFGGVDTRHAYPVRGGVPFARGILESPDHLRLRCGAEDRECQIALTATWPDGTVKWILVDCWALDGEQLTLEYGEGVHRAETSSRPMAEDNGESIIVKTGPLNVTIRRHGTGFLDEVRFDGRIVVAANPSERCNVLDFVHTQSPADRVTNTSVICGISDQSEVQISYASIEVQGPIHTVVLVRGSYRYKYLGVTIPELEGPLACPFSIRYHFWRGSGMIGVEHFYAYEGDPDHDFVRQAGLSLQLHESFRADFATYGDRSEGSITIESARCTGLHQSSSDHYDLWEQRPDGSVSNVKAGRRSTGWTDISDGRIGVSMGIRRMAEQYEKALHVSAETGRMDAWLWPPEAQTMDMRRYAREWGVGEDGAYESGPMPSNYRLAAKGCGKSHELLIHFHNSGVGESDTSAIFRVFENRPLLLADPEYYASSGVLGKYLSRSRDRYPDLEDVIAKPFEYLLAAQKQAKWYGIFDYGDVQTCYATFHGHDRWESDFGRWGWGNGDQVGRLNYALMLQFVRTLDRDIFDLAEANMLHVHDVDTTHSHAYPFKMGDEFLDLAGSVHRHNAQHWACPYVGSRGAHPMGARIHYFLTGSGRSQDILDDVLGLSCRIPEGAARDGHGTSALSHLCAWERSGDPVHREKALASLDAYGLEDIRGGWLAMISAAFGVFDAMVEYTDLTEDHRFIPTIMKFATMCMAPEIEDNWTYPGGYFRIYAEGLRYSGELAHDSEGGQSFDREDFLKGIQRARKRLTEQMKDSAPYLPREQWPAPKGASAGAFPNFSIDANTLRDLPFLMGAIELIQERHAGN